MAKAKASSHNNRKVQSFSCNSTTRIKKPLPRSVACKLSRSVVHIRVLALVLVAYRRLDKMTSGLLLVTTLTDMVHKLTSPRHQVPKRYRATLKDPPNLREQAAMVRHLPCCLRIGHSGKGHFAQCNCATRRLRNLKADSYCFTVKRSPVGQRSCCLLMAQALLCV